MYSLLLLIMNEWLLLTARLLARQEHPKGLQLDPLTAHCFGKVKVKTEWCYYEGNSVLPYVACP